MQICKLISIGSKWANTDFFIYVRCLGKSYNLSYSVDVKANISSIKSLTEQIQKGLENIKLPAGISKSFNSNISTILNELKELDRISDKTTLGISDTKQADKSWEKISAALEGVKLNLKNLGTDGADAAEAINKLIPQSTINKISKLSEVLEKAEKSLKGYDNSRESQDLQNRLNALKETKKLAEEEAKAIQLSEKEQKRLAKAQAITNRGSGLSKGLLDFKDEEKNNNYLENLQKITEARKQLTEANKKAKETGAQEDKVRAAALKEARDNALKDFNEMYGTSLKGQGEGGKDVKNLEKQLAAYRQAAIELLQLQDKLNKFNEKNDAVSDLEKQISGVEESLSNLVSSKSQQIVNELAASMAE